jgi:hypothetical protein
VDSDGKVASNDGVFVGVGVIVGVSVVVVVAVGEEVAVGGGVGVSALAISSTTGIEVEVVKLTTFTIEVAVGSASTEVFPKPHANSRTGKDRKMKLRFIVHYDKLTWVIPQIANRYRSRGFLNIQKLQ